MVNQVTWEVRLRQTLLMGRRRAGRFCLGPASLGLENDFKPSARTGTDGHGALQLTDQITHQLSAEGIEAPVL